MPSLLDFFALNAVLALFLAAIIGVVSLLIHSPTFANRAWLLVMLKLVTPPLVAIPILWSHAPTPAVRLPVEETEITLSDEEIEAILARLKSEPLPEAMPDVETLADASAPFPWESVLTVGLLTGSVAWWSLTAVRIQRFRSALARVGGVKPAPEEVQAMGRETARSLRLRRMPELEMVDANWSPMLWVLGRTPRVILPRKLWDTLDVDQRRAVLAHEFAHYSRKDHWVRRLELLVIGLYWWLPVAWFARRQLRRAEEACCDQLVLASLPEHASKYAEALVETAVYVSKPRLVPLASGGATNVHNLKRRLQMIFQPRFLSRTQKVAVALVLTLGLIALPFGLVAGQDKVVSPVESTTPAKPQKPEKTEKPSKAEKPVAETISSTNPSAKPEWSKSEPASTTSLPSPAMVQALKDEIELLQVQLEAKSVALQSASRNVEIAKEICDNSDQLAKKGSISRSEVLQFTKELIKAQSDMETRRAEMAEHKVRLSQAMRKLEALVAAKPQVGFSTNKIDPTKVDATKAEKLKAEAAKAERIKAEMLLKEGTAKTLPADKVHSSVEVEMLQLARERVLQELNASAKVMAELANTTASMSESVKMLEAQLRYTQDQLERIRLQQEEMHKLRSRKQQEAETITIELQKLLEIEKSKPREKKPETR